MADDTTQRAVHQFLAQRLQNLETFTKQDIQNITGWADKALATYWSKQFKGLFEKVDSTRYRVRERFWQYQDWKKFKSLVTQVKGAATYAPTVYDTVVSYEFYLPLAHEVTMRAILDSLFYEDVVMPRLRRIGLAALRKYFKKGADFLPDWTDEHVYGAARKIIDEKFGDYSIYHVDGRFRADNLMTRPQAMNLQVNGQRYLVDETTAVVRFIFPCQTDQAETIRFLFKELFMDPITDQVSGEDQIWVVESGSRSQVQVWKPQD